MFSETGDVAIKENGLQLSDVDIQSFHHVLRNTMRNGSPQVSFNALPPPCQFSGNPSDTSMLQTAESASSSKHLADHWTNQVVVHAAFFFR